MVDTKKLLEIIKGDPIIQKYIYNGTWLSGSSTIVYPITFWKNEVEIQLTTHKNVFERFIDRFLKQNSDLLIGGSFSRMDGSCPSTLTFWYNTPENQGYKDSRKRHKLERKFWRTKAKELINAPSLSEYMNRMKSAYNEFMQGLDTFGGYTAVDKWKRLHPLTKVDYAFLIQEYDLDKDIIDL